MLVPLLQMEEIVGKHPAVAEAAVIGVEDDLKGEVRGS